jgi:hypothetical protein
VSRGAVVKLNELRKKIRKKPKPSDTAFPISHPATRCSPVSLELDTMPALMTQATAMCGADVSARLTRAQQRSTTAGALPRAQSRKSVKVNAAATDPLLLRVARGEQGERPPVWLMRQAGRYMAGLAKHFCSCWFCCSRRAG